MNLLRETIKRILIESHFPLSGGEKLRIHHSRPETRAEDDVMNSGSWPKDSNFKQEIGPKPNGLWYECQDGSSSQDWKEFCETGMTSGYRYDRT